MDSPLSALFDPRRLRTRAAVLSAVRRWFADHAYLEVPTKALVPSAAMEEHLYPIRAGSGWLRTSPEFALKRVVEAGLGRVYEIGPCWRDREQGPWHSPEFTMMEWYRVGAELCDLMAEAKGLIEAARAAVGNNTPLSWKRTTVRQLFIDTTGVDPATSTAEDLSGIDEPWDDAFFRRWVTDVEPTFTGALIVEDWPASQAALARVRDDGDWPVAQRFEVYVDGVELANAFLELTNEQEQRRRFASANAARVSAGEQPNPIDPEFVQAVGRMPRTSGIAMGFDRLVAVAAGWSSIE